MTGEREDGRDVRSKQDRPAGPPAHPPAVVVVYVQPRAARTEVAGRHGDAVKIRVQAPPVDGAANVELVRFLAERLGVPKRAVTIVGGARGRLKRVAIEAGPADPVATLLGE
jgi:uncharacterized protein (TIGR00251 family)